jgi:hypothetical protein
MLNRDKDLKANLGDEKGLDLKRFCICSNSPPGWFLIAE